MFLCSGTSSGEGVLVGDGNVWSNSRDSPHLVSFTCLSFQAFLIQYQSTSRNKDFRLYTVLSLKEVEGDRFRRVARILLWGGGGGGAYLNNRTK